jgi:phosphate:Na+ symporter
MQSSSAAAATTLGALNAGSLTFQQGCAMIVGQSIGTTATTALMMIGGRLAVRRAALAHILFGLIVGVLAMMFLGPLAAAADWAGPRLDDPDGVLALAAFSTIFKLAGVVAFVPLDPSLLGSHRPDHRKRQRIGAQPSGSGGRPGGRRHRAR